MNIMNFKRVTSGKRLPVQYINSSVLPLKVIRDPDQSREEILVLSILDNFDSVEFKRVLGMAQNLTEGWAKQIIIAYPDYHRLNDEHSILSQMQSFMDDSFIQKVKVESWNINLHSFEGERRND
jgi:hypothetical protein